MSKISFVKNKTINPQKKMGLENAQQDYVNY